MRGSSCRSFHTSICFHTSIGSDTFRYISAKQRPSSFPSMRGSLLKTCPAYSTMKCNSVSATRFRSTSHANSLLCFRRNVKAMLNRHVLPPASMTRFLYFEKFCKMPFLPTVLYCSGRIKNLERYFYISTLYTGICEEAVEQRPSSSSVQDTSCPPHQAHHNRRLQ